MQKLTLATTYYLRHQRYVDARRSAEQLVQADPVRSGAYVLRGDALAGLGDSDGALEAYRQALALIHPAYEPPVDLFRRIETVTSARRVDRPAAR